MKVASEQHVALHVGEPGRPGEHHRPHASEGAAERLTRRKRPRRDRTRGVVHCVGGSHVREREHTRLMKPPTFHHREREWPRQGNTQSSIHGRAPYVVLERVDARGTTIRARALACRVHDTIAGDPGIGPSAHHRPSPGARAALELTHDVVPVEGPDLVVVARHGLGQALQNQLHQWR